MIPPAAAELALQRLAAFPAAPLGHFPTPIEELPRFRAAAGLAPRILVKRDDAIPFAFGGNKVRKLRYLMPAVLAGGADMVVTCGGVQSNHARATAAACAVLGLDCHLVVNGAEPVRPTGNALLNRLLGATFEYVAGREDRLPAMERAAVRLRAAGWRVAVVPLGASTPHGALGYLAAVVELLSQGPAPEVIVHACSSGGTTAGLLAGCALARVPTRVIGISADDPPDRIREQVRSILRGMATLLEVAGEPFEDLPIEIDDAFVGPDYGEPSDGSTEAQSLAARTAGLFVDHTYSAKALAGLIQYCRDGRIPAGATVLFWHTGGQVGLFG
jgi:L-cysteate sulfo-lyase